MMLSIEFQSPRGSVEPRVEERWDHTPAIPTYVRFLNSMDMERQIVVRLQQVWIWFPTTVRLPVQRLTRRPAVNWVDRHNPSLVYNCRGDVFRMALETGSWPNRDTLRSYCIEVMAWVVGSDTHLEAAWRAMMRQPRAGLMLCDSFGVQALKVLTWGGSEERGDYPNRGRRVIFTAVVEVPPVETRC